MSIVYWTSIWDVAIVVVVLAIAFFYIRRTVLANLFLLIIALFLLGEFLSYMGLKLLSDFLFLSLQLAIIALLIVFQPELRRLFLRFSSVDIRLKNWFSVKRMSNQRNPSKETVNWEPVITALQNMQSERIGAIVIIARKSALSYYAESGVLMDAQINARLLEAIFQPQSPLHDGAVIIKNNRIVSASAILPVSEGQAISGRKGLRHRAAIGLVERTDAVAVVLSEETGKLFMAHDDYIEEDVSIESLRKRLKRLFSEDSKTSD
ncbi:MAG: DNA integrity scanning protein DisA nucleotide-binding domain protein [Cryomorphaceae bacterium]|nr:DNA integrity scanning protein DisA nucleotide-binding domain protein [Cryomorphaceae bacterium]